MSGHIIWGYLCRFMSMFWKLSSFWQVSLLSPEELASASSRTLTVWLLTLAEICTNISYGIGYIF